MRPVALAGALALACWLPAGAAVVSSAENGCVVTETVHIAAAPSQVYELILQPAKWWNPQHTFSHDAANLSLEARAGGCFCEKASDGSSVQHLVVVRVAPGKLLTLRGALGPFQAQAVDGALTWSLQPASNGQTDLTLTYVLGGYLSLPGGFARWAKAADDMLAEQVGRLQKVAEGGR